jgi:sulfite exporter TauE/SafE
VSPLADYSAAVSALLLGFAGLVHCVGMCGGIAATLTLSAP